MDKLNQVFSHDLNSNSFCQQIGDSLFYDLPRVRLDGGARAFRRRWGYELTPPPTLVEEENEDDPYALPNDDGDNLSYTETRSLREDYLFHSSQGKAWRGVGCCSSLAVGHGEERKNLELVQTGQRKRHGLNRTGWTEYEYRLEQCRLSNKRITGWMVLADLKMNIGLNSTGLAKKTLRMNCSVL